MRLFALLLFLSLALGQALLPARTFGLEFREKGGAWVYEGEGVRLVYVPGVGWAEPLLELPPPEGERLPLEVLKALAPIARPSLGDASSGWSWTFPPPTWEARRKGWGGEAWRWTFPTWSRAC